MSVTVLSTEGIHTAYATFTYNGKTYYSNVFYFLVGITKDSPASMTLPVGTYRIYANYTRGSDTYASTISNEVTVKVLEKTVKDIAVSVESVTLPSQVEIKVSSNIDGIYAIDVNGTEVKVTVTGGKGSEFITLGAGNYYANVTGESEATITNALFTVYPEPKNGKLIIRDYNYPSNATISIVSDDNVIFNIEYYAE